MATENDSSTSSAHLGEACASNQAGGPIVDQVFSLFKDYLQNQLETKTEEIEQRSKIDKEDVRLKYRGNQKQFELNAAIDSILENIETETQQSRPSNDRIRSLAQDARQLLRKRQKLIKIADKSKDGWQVFAEYESDELASDSEDEKRLKKAHESASRKRRQKDQAKIERGPGKRRDLVGALIISFFVVRPSVTSFYFVISHNSDPLANPSIFLVCLIIYGNGRVK